MTRKNINKKIRFEIFKRDSFKCCYCGRSAPEILLEIDHINPVSKGGDNSILNLITSCFDCNRGKGAVELKDNTMISKQKVQLDLLQKKREQLILLQEWRDGLKNLKQETIDFYEKFIIQNSLETTLSEHGRKQIAQWIDKFSQEEIISGIETAFSQYFEICQKQKDTWYKFNLAFNYVPKIITNKRTTINNPQLKELQYCRAILRNRFQKKGYYYDEAKATKFLKVLLDKFTFDSIRNSCCNFKNWSEFSTLYYDNIK